MLVVGNVAKIHGFRSKSFNAYPSVEKALCVKAYISSRPSAQPWWSIVKNIGWEKQLTLSNTTISRWAAKFKWRNCCNDNKAAESLFRSGQSRGECDQVRTTKFKNVTGARGPQSQLQWAFLAPSVERNVSHAWGSLNTKKNMSSAENKRRIKKSHSLR